VPKRGQDNIVVRCTVSKTKHPRLHRALSDVAALERPEWFRLHATIGHALASNQSVLELLTIAVGEQTTNVQGKRSPRSPESEGAVATKADTDRPTDDYLDHLADSVLSRS
jgi:hypothetical protein